MLLRGIAASRGQVEGVAVKADSPDEALKKMRNIEKPILVVGFTDPKWVPAIIKAKGIVTSTGGILSHAAIVSREFGIPSVVGILNAMYSISDNDCVKVNGDAGVVEILGG